MSNHKTDVLFPVGRFVMGSLTDPQTTDAEGKPLVTKTGPNAGQPRSNFFFAVAIPKNGSAAWWDTEWGKKILAVGQAAFPQQWQSPKFAWKIEDGDSQIPNSNGHKPCEREGFPGNWVVRLGSGFAPKTLTAKGDAAVDPASIKLGHYIEVLGNVDGNGSAQQPGVYINHSMVAHSGFALRFTSVPIRRKLASVRPPCPPVQAARPSPRWQRRVHLQRLLLRQPRRPPRRARPSSPSRIRQSSPGRPHRQRLRVRPRRPAA